MHPRSAAPYYVVLAGTLIACALMGLCVLQLFQSRHDALDRARDVAKSGARRRATSSAISSCTGCRWRR